MNDPKVQRELGRLTRRSLLTGGLAALVGGGAWEWLRTRREDDSEAWPLRAALRLDEQLWRDYSSDKRLARTFPLSAVEQPRHNGDEGMEEPVGADWKLRVEGLTDSPLTLGMDEIRALPKTEMVTQLKRLRVQRRRAVQPDVIFAIRRSHTHVGVGVDLDRKLAILHSAATLHDPKSPGLQLEALRDDRAGQHSIRINDRYRICFVWHDGKAVNVEIVDYH